MTRALTDDEERAFIGGGSLPSGVGLDPEKVLLEFQAPHDDQTQVVEGGGITREAKGEYHAELPVGMDQAGTWQWRGRGEEEDGSPFASTAPQTFEAYRTF